MLQETQIAAGTGYRESRIELKVAAGVEDGRDFLETTNRALGRDKEPGAAKRQNDLRLSALGAAKHFRERQQPAQVEGRGINGMVSEVPWADVPPESELSRILAGLLSTERIVTDLQTDDDLRRQQKRVRKQLEAWLEREDSRK